MSRAYLFTAQGEQVGPSAHWYGDLVTNGKYLRQAFRPQAAYIVAVRRKGGYRLLKTPLLPGGYTMQEHIGDTRMSHSMFSARAGQLYLPTIDAVRAYLTLGGEVL